VTVGKLVGYAKNESSSRSAGIAEVEFILLPS